MKHLIRRIASVVAVAVWATTLGLIAHSAVEAAPSAGWYWYTDDLDRDGRPNDMYVYWDSSGWRLDWWVYLDIDHNGVWDVAARDFNRDGRLDQVWFDFDQDRAGRRGRPPHDVLLHRTQSAGLPPRQVRGIRPVLVALLLHPHDDHHSGPGSRPDVDPPPGRDHRLGCLTVGRRSARRSAARGPAACSVAGPLRDRCALPCSLSVAVDGTDDGDRVSWFPSRARVAGTARSGGTTMNRTMCWIWVPAWSETGAPS